MVKSDSDFGTVKNVGIAAINAIVEERNKNGKFEDFASFYERIKDEAVNKKCIECLIKAGAFDSLGKNRATLLASFEKIIDSINSTNKNVLENQVSMFDILDENEVHQEKYTYEEMPEMDMRVLLSYEKEMLGIYISGHPLDKYREQIANATNVDSLKMLKVTEEIETTGQSISYKDGQNVKYAGIINKVKKKFTKNNTMMAFVTVEDLFGTTEIIVFDSVYSKSASFLMEENVIYIEGRISIREDEPVKIVASKIEEFSEDIVTKPTQNKITTMVIDITTLDESNKDKLRGAIKFFSGERANMKLQIKEGEIIKPCGALLATENIVNIFQKIVGENNVMFM